MDARQWTVLIADLRGSRRIVPRRRPAVDRALERAVSRTLRRHGEAFRLAPQVLRGDELQAVLRPEVPALAVLTYLRAHLATGVARAPALRAGLGEGTIARLSPKGPFASEGEAFHRAREALDRARAASSARLTAWRSGRAEFDGWAEAVLALTDAIQARWTKAQWEAIIGRLEGKALDAIARTHHVRFQSVSKRLRAASWSEVHQAFEHLEARRIAGARDRG